MSQVERGKALQARWSRERRFCDLCPRLCHHSCPVMAAEGDPAVSPRDKNAAALRLPPPGEAPALDHAELLYKCLGCRLCQTFCEHGNDVASSLFAARAAAVSAGVEPPGAQALRARYAAWGNPHGEDLQARLRALSRRRCVGADETGGDTRPARRTRLYWPGCDTLHHRPELVGKTLAVAERLGEGELSVYCGEQQCCGYPLLAAGDLEGFAAQARRLAADLQGLGALYTSSPECAWTFSVAWPTYAGVDPPAPVVGHVIDLLRPAMSRAPESAPVDLDAAWHDPCYLGRFLGRYDEPRDMMNRVLATPMQEPQPWTREASWCCGGGGVLPDTSPATADAITRQRVADLTGTSSGPPGQAPAGERRIVTACPTCEGRFREAGAQALDVVDVLATWLGLPGDEAGDA